MGFGDGIGGNRPDLTTLMQRPSALGKVFFCSSAATGGDDNNEGTDPSAPMLQISAALDKCTAGKGDVIVNMQDSPSSPNEVSFPISLDVAGVLLTGLYSRGQLSDSGFGSDVQNQPAITFAAHYVTVENLYLGIASTGNTGGVIQFSGEAVYCATVRNCLIEAQNTSAYGIYAFAANGTDLPYLLVEDNVFGSAHGSIFSSSAIRLSNSTRGMIRNNVFHPSASYGIHLPSGCRNTAIYDNKFHLAADTDGFAVYIADGAYENTVSGNQAFFGLAAPGNKPFFEAGTDGDNSWGINWKGETAVAGEA